MALKPTDLLYFPMLNGKLITDSQGKPRVYRSRKNALEHLKRIEYDHVLVYLARASLTKEEFEKRSIE